MSETEIKIPDEIQKAIDLTDYAVKTRYLGEREPVTKDEYEEALTIAEVVYSWASSIIKADVK